MAIREKRWLGGLQVPFSTLYLEGRIEGLFRVETPIVNLGYQMKSTEPARGGGYGGDGDEEGFRRMTGAGTLERRSRCATYVCVMVCDGYGLSCGAPRRSPAPAAGGLLRAP